MTTIAAAATLRSLSLEERKALSAWEAAERLNEVIAAMDAVREARKVYITRLRDARKAKLRCPRTDIEARVAYEERILDAKAALESLVIDAQFLRQEMSGLQTHLRAIPT